MKSTVENLTPTRIRLAVEVPFDELKAELDSAYKTIGGQVRVPGFRPGKVPARVIDQRVGRSTVVQEAVNNALPRIYGDAVREHELKVLGQPDIDIGTLDDGSSLSFTAEIDLQPEITLPDLDGIEVTVDDIEVSDAEVEEQLEGLRHRFGTLKSVERPAHDGDYVSIDLKTLVDGEEMEHGAATGLSYVVGSDDLVPGLDEAIGGKSGGESTQFHTTLRQGEHAGDEAEVLVTVSSVKEMELPQVDDEFAQLASEFDTIDELTQDLRARLARAKALGQGAQARDRLVDAVVSSVEFALPESPVRAEIDFRQHEIVHSLDHDDELFHRYLDTEGKTREEFEAEMRESAEKSVRAQFVLDAIADATDVQIGDAELTEYLVRQAAQYDMAPQEFANQVVQSGNLQALIAGVRRNKVLANLLESAVVTDSSGNPVDLTALVEQVPLASPQEADVTELAPDSSGESPSDDATPPETGPERSDPPA